MKDTIRSLVRHLLVVLASLGSFLLSKDLIGPDDVEATNAAGAGLIEVISALVVAMLTWVFVKYFPNKITNGERRVSDDDVKSPSGGGGSLPLGILLVCAISLLCLPSCGTGFVGSVSYRDAESGAKGGLAFDGEGKPHGFFRLPIFDPKTGEQVGEIQATK